MFAILPQLRETRAFGGNIRIEVGREVLSAGRLPKTQSRARAEVAAQTYQPARLRPGRSLFL